jgi:NAD dependent epimerase/dehydratase family
MKILIGHTGFVGSNLSNQAQFDGLFNSKNVSKSFGLNPDLLVYSGVRAEKFLANSDPENDFLIIENAINNIKKINPKKIVLISTVDVYPSPISVNENSEIDNYNLQPYGKNRLYLESWVENNFDDYLIVRLPALIGENLKKNFIYDIINVIPAMLNQTLFDKLNAEYNWIKDYYDIQENGFFKLISISEDDRAVLKNKFLEINFTSLNFTDSRGIFQFYNLNNLYKDIEIAIKNNIKKLNLATEPVSVNEIYQALFNKNFGNELGGTIPNYDFHTLHSKSFAENSNYIQNKQHVLASIKEFVNQQSK